MYLDGCFGYFYFFSAWGGRRGSPRCRGGGSVDLHWKSQEGGGVLSGKGRGRGAGRVSAANRGIGGGGGLNIFSGPRCPPSYAIVHYVQLLRNYCAIVAPQNPFKTRGSVWQRALDRDYCVALLWTITQLVRLFPWPFVLRPQDPSYNLSPNYFYYF